MQLPNRKTNVFEYWIEYDPDKSAIVDDIEYDDLCTTVLGNTSTKL